MLLFQAASRHCQTNSLLCLLRSPLLIPSPPLPTPESISVQSQLHLPNLKMWWHHNKAWPLKIHVRHLLLNFFTAGQTVEISCYIIIHSPRCLCWLNWCAGESHHYDALHLTILVKLRRNSGMDGSVIGYSLSTAFVLCTLEKLKLSQMKCKMLKLT